MENLRFVIVVWVDSHEPAENAEVEFLELPVPLDIISAGLVVKETDWYMTIAGAWKPDNRTYDYVISIPKVSIKEIKELTYEDSERHSIGKTTTGSPKISKKKK